MFIYIVQEGEEREDSDSLILGIFSTVELARAFCQQHPPKVPGLTFSISKFAVDHPEEWYDEVSVE